MALKMKLLFTEFADLFVKQFPPIWFILTMHKKSESRHEMHTFSVVYG